LSSCWPHRSVRLGRNAGKILMRHNVRSVTVSQISISIVSCFGVTLGALLFFYAVSPWTDHKVIPLFGSRLSDTAIFGVIGLFCVFVTIQLLRSKRWAWWFAFVIAAITLGLAIIFLILVLHPRNDFERSESGFGLGISLCLLIPGAVSTILLSLPSVRRRFSSSRKIEQPI
jgi:hypothetical protein